MRCPQSTVIISYGPVWVLDQYRSSKTFLSKDAIQPIYELPLKLLLPHVGIAKWTLNYHFLVRCTSHINMLSMQFMNSWTITSHIYTGSNYLSNHLSMLKYHYKIPMEYLRHSTKIISLISETQFKSCFFSVFIGINSLYFTTKCYLVFYKRLFAQMFVQPQIKENIKALRHWPLWGEFTGDRWIPLTNG